MPCGAFNFNFYKKNIELFKGKVISQTSALPEFTRSQHWIPRDSFFLNDDGGTCLDGEQKNFKGESNMDDAMSLESN